ncbi:MAG: class I SAM-dependent methyltransferase [Candidatus Dormibacteraeota bacterium]|nr:class I SAM-dependent methyltransferase [Candidatus Dormibacteraeota bacterium]
MASALDISAYPPDGMEIRLIERFARLQGRRILEVGCGDGRLTFQYARTAREVLAFDPDRPSIEEALDQQALLDVRNVAFRLGSIEHLPARGAPFDVALFSWSL